MKHFFSVFTLLLLLGCAWTAEKTPAGERMHGLSFVAPPYQFSGNPMTKINALGANYISVIPIAYTRLEKPTVRYNMSDWQWWGERPEGVEKTIELAHAVGIKVLLKPQVYVPGSWPGGLNFKRDADWEKWEDTYRAYMFAMAEIAEKYKTEIFCIGTEFKISSRERPDFWRQFIKEIREIYSGKLTYAANWDEYKHIEFWDELDYIGVDAYFPLSEVRTPTVAELKKAWQTPAEEMERVQQKFKKPIIFTEYGYMSVDGCAGKIWEIEPNIQNIAVNETAQANAVQAVNEFFAKKKWWAGGFIWKWFPEMQGHEGYPAKDYTPQGKEAEVVLRKFFKKSSEN